MSAIPLDQRTDPKVSTTPLVNRIGPDARAGSKHVIYGSNRLRDPCGRDILKADGQTINRARPAEAAVPAPRLEEDQLLLVREMHHRVANTLTFLACLIRREFTGSMSAPLRDPLARCEARIAALGKLNRILAVGAAERQISLRHYIEHLAEALSEALLCPLGVRCEVFAEAGEFPIELCERLGLVISELVTNAAKHGFYGREDGVVRIELRRKGESWLCLIADNGVGTKTASIGAGSKIVEQLVKTIGGKLVCKSGPNGTTVIVTWKRAGSDVIASAPS